MKIYKYITFPVFFIILISCETKNTEEGIEGAIFCNLYDLGLSDSDNIITPSDSNPVVWKGNYSDNTVKISYTKDINKFGVSESLNFVFNKIDNCLQIDRGYEFYNGGFGDVSAITQVYVLKVTIQDWELNEKLSGQIIYRDHHDKLVKTINFWVEFTADDYFIEDTNYTYFSDCFGDKLPIDIDLDEDGTIDYTIIAEEEVDFANNPNFVAYNIKLVSTDESINEILSPKNVSAPFPVIFEAPFSTENTRSYAANKFNSAEVRNSLDVFYEFEAPYENYNFFLQNNLTYLKEFRNTIPDYYAVKLIRNNQKFYGWIKMNFNALNCEIEVLDMYLNPNANQHINVED
ncbi:hypothetical protein [Polaribacter vadi]|uniref:hypothetical protein n=1 Tax=Polaribacter vadi TaxID=1774273 RepID=UPI0030EBE1BE|tara:strand:- start:7973 stop:9013 length:1041 start_codon:yes stop_codon:yes gene_type:complete